MMFNKLEDILPLIDKPLLLVDRYRCYRVMLHSLLLDDIVLRDMLTGLLVYNPITFLQRLKYVWIYERELSNTIFNSLK